MISINDGPIVIFKDGYTVGSGRKTAYTGEYTITGCGKTDNTIVIKEGNISITIENVDINTSGTAFSIEGRATVNLTLNGQNRLESGHKQAGLHVPTCTSLIITEESKGSLEAIGKGVYGCGHGGAGIGSNPKENYGVIIINGGIVNAIATDVTNAAGIGGGSYGAGGNITINGGTVTAFSNGLGAGIGGGFERDGGNITINGGAVDATSTRYGAGIGGGFRGDGGHIQITGGIVKAIGGCYSAGIGGGYDEVGGEVTISGGVVMAIGNDNVGIGGSQRKEKYVFFDTGLAGNAIIFTNKLGNTLYKEYWSGLIFSENEGIIRSDGNKFKQIDANTMEDISLKLTNNIEKLLENSGLNVSLTNQITVFEAAVAGTKEMPEGSDGSYSFIIEAKINDKIYQASGTGVILAEIYKETNQSI